MASIVTCRQRQNERQHVWLSLKHENRRKAVFLRQQGKVKKSIDKLSKMRYTVYRIENKTKTIQTPLVVIYAALNS